MNGERCGWATTELSIPYHDNEWGRPVHSDRVFFEFLILEGAQAGLSWETILKKRERYREVYEGFEPSRVAQFGARDRARLLKDPGIVRNRLKVESSISNAKSFVALQEEFGSFDGWVWPYVGGAPKMNRRRTMKDVPASTAESDALSKALKARGFRFVGTTIMYAFMQATGLVNDHLVACKWRETRNEKREKGSGGGVA